LIDFLLPDGRRRVPGRNSFDRPRGLPSPSTMCWLPPSSCVAPGSSALRLERARRQLISRPSRRPAPDADPSPPPL